MSLEAYKAERPCICQELSRASCKRVLEEAVAKGLLTEGMLTPDGVRHFTKRLRGHVAVETIDDDSLESATENLAALQDTEVVDSAAATLAAMRASAEAAAGAEDID